MINRLRLNYRIKTSAISILFSLVLVKLAAAEERVRKYGLRNKKFAANVIGKLTVCEEIVKIIIADGVYCTLDNL